MQHLAIERRQLVVQEALRRYLRRIAAVVHPSRNIGVPSFLMGREHHIFGSLLDVRPAGAIGEEQAGGLERLQRQHPPVQLAGIALGCRRGSAAINDAWPSLIDTLPLKRPWVESIGEACYAM